MIIESECGQFTVGLCFLNDLFYLLRLPDFHYYLAQPVLLFLRELDSFADEAPILDCEIQPDFVEEAKSPIFAIKPLLVPDGGASYHSSVSSEEESTDMPFFQMGAFGTDVVKPLKDL
jgi:hypothetical protein